MKFIPFYEEYLENVILIKLAEVVQAKAPTSLADFRRGFNTYFGLNVSYDQFRAWTRDLGIQVEHRASITLPNRGTPAPHPEQRGPQVPKIVQAPSHASAPLEYDFGQNPRQPEPKQEPQRTVPGRGGIALGDLFNQ
jgi:hypothetical protein